jgi:hypothetical protein
MDKLPLNFTVWRFYCGTFGIFWHLFIVGACILLCLLSNYKIKLPFATKCANLLRTGVLSCSLIFWHDSLPPSRTKTASFNRNIATDLSVQICHIWTAPRWFFILICICKRIVSQLRVNGFQWFLFYFKTNNFTICWSFSNFSRFGIHQYKVAAEYSLPAGTSYCHLIVLIHT